MCDMSKMVSAEVLVTYASWKPNVKHLQLYTHEVEHFFLEFWCSHQQSPGCMIKFDIAYLTCIAFSYLQLRKSQGAAVQHISRCADLKFWKMYFFDMEHFRCLWLKGNFTVTLPSWDTCILTIQVVVSCLVGTTWVLMEFRPPRGIRHAQTFVIYPSHNQTYIEYTVYMPTFASHNYQNLGKYNLHMSIPCKRVVVFVCCSRSTNITAVFCHSSL